MLQWIVKIMIYAILLQGCALQERAGVLLQDTIDDIKEDLDNKYTPTEVEAVNPDDAENEPVVLIDDNQFRPSSGISYFTILTDERTEWLISPETKTATLITYKNGAEVVKSYTYDPILGEVSIGAVSINIDDIIQPIGTSSGALEIVEINDLGTGSSRGYGILVPYDMVSSNQTQTTVDFIGPVILANVQSTEVLESSPAETSVDFSTGLATTMFDSEIGEVTIENWELSGDRNEPLEVVGNINGQRPIVGAVFGDVFTDGEVGELGLNFKFLDVVSEDAYMGSHVGAPK